MRSAIADTVAMKTNISTASALPWPKSCRPEVVLPKAAAGLLSLCREDLQLDIAGLMCIPPLDEEAGVHFAFLAKLAGELGLKQLSMGMSADFETAIAFGATYVRVGSEIFGARPVIPAESVGSRAGTQGKG